jgi:type VI secretion system VasD/TssJ family lipoprotein
MAIRRYRDLASTRSFVRAVHYALLPALIAGMSACAGTVPTCQVPNSVELELETSDRVNIDQSGEALPTNIRLYQLKNLSSVQSATFDDMLDRPK